MRECLSQPRTGWTSRESTWKKPWGKGKACKNIAGACGQASAETGAPRPQTQDSDLTSHDRLFPADSREVKVGEYNAVADTLEIINDTIRFQGKAGGLLRGGACSGPPRPGHCLRAGDKRRVTGFRGKREHPQSTHSLRMGHPRSHGNWAPAPGMGPLYLRGVLALTKASVFQPPSHQE